MIDLHYWTTPNGHKITIFLEETGLPYKIFPVNIGKGEQFAKDFLKISPNNRIPAMIDHDPPGGGAFAHVGETWAAWGSRLFRAVRSAPRERAWLSPRAPREARSTRLAAPIRDWLPPSWWRRCGTRGR